MRGKLVIINEEKFISRFLAFLLNWNVICGIFEGISQIINPVLQLKGINTTFFAMAFILVTGFIIIKRNKYSFSLLMLLLWLIFLLISFVIVPPILAIASRAIIYFVLNIFCISYLFSQIRDIKQLLDNLMLYVYFCLIYCAIQFFLPENAGNYSMTFTYSTMVSGLLTLIRGLKEKNRRKRVIYLIIFLFIFISNLKYGSRGGMVCYVFAIVLLFYFSDRRKQIKISVSFTALILLVAVNFSKIIEFLMLKFPNSRNIRLIASGQFFYWSGRDEYYSYILDQIKIAPLKFRGLYSDRIYLANWFGREGKDELWGTYAHNIYLEALFQFGCLMLPVLMASTIYIFFYLRRVKRTYYDELIVLSIIFISFSVCQLMLSSSYLLAPSFGGLVGMLLMEKRLKRPKSDYKIKKKMEFNM